MKLKKMLALLLIAVMALSLAACGNSSDNGDGDVDGGNETGGILNIYMWSDYISDEVIRDFENEYGIKVNFAYMNSSEEAVAKLTTGGGSEYDLAMPCDLDMTALISAGVLEEMDLSNIPNMSNLDPAYVGRSFDPDNVYAIPYLMNYLYVIYDENTVPIEITSYNDLLSPELKDQVASVTGISNLFPMALAALDLNPNSQDEDEIEQAYEWLRDYMKNVRVLTSDATEQGLLQGTCSVAYVFDGQASRAYEAGLDMGIAMLEDPIQLGFDNFVIPKGAANKDNAELFLNYILDADVMAKNLIDCPYSCPNAAAVAKAEDSYKENPALNLPDEMKNNYYLQLDTSDAAVIYDRYWTQLLAE